MNSDYIACASLVVALLALFSTGWQAWIAHRHSRLSVKPLLAWTLSRSHGPDGIEVVATISNKGLGPAIVTGRNLAWKGERFTTLPTDNYTLDKLVEQHFPADWSCQVLSRNIPNIDDVILQGDTVTVARILVSHKSLQGRPHLEWKLGELGIILGFKDLYDNHAVIRTKGDITRRLSLPRR